jgi:hypothetical protein
MLVVVPIRQEKHPMSDFFIVGGILWLYVCYLEEEKKKMDLLQQIADNSKKSDKS